MKVPALLFQAWCCGSQSRGPLSPASRKKESGLTEPLSAYTKLTHFISSKALIAKQVGLVYQATSEIRVRGNPEAKNESQAVTCRRCQSTVI